MGSTTVEGSLERTSIYTLNTEIVLINTLEKSYLQLYRRWFTAELFLTVKVVNNLNSINRETK